MKSSAVSAALLLTLAAHCAADLETSAADLETSAADLETSAADLETSAADLETLRRLAGFLSPGHATAQCTRMLTFGGDCQCNYRDPESGRSEDIQFDMHVYGRRRVCIAKGYLYPGGACRILSVQVDSYNGQHSKLWTQLSEFGCSKNTVKQMYSDDKASVTGFSLLREMAQMGVRHLELLDVSVPGSEQQVLGELLRRKPKVTAQQVALTVVLDEYDVMGDPGSSFTVDLARRYLKLLTKLEAVGYRMLSFTPHPRCVEAVQKTHNICLPILSNTVWIK